MVACPNLNERKSRPQTLGGAFGGLLRLLGGRVSDADLLARWEEIVGAEIASIAKLSGISRGTKKTGRTLTVKSINPAAALTLSYQTNDIRDRVNKYFGYEAITKITIRK
ncbi:MAG: DUF721 domain-containing protein [Alphaproteobacteria bacterium]|nr:DUF721 domain-containing protein [Alphaproteobacteria bacterium]